MLTLPHLLTTARRFVDGVCAIPRIATIADRDFFASQRHLELERAAKWLAEERDGLKQQLAAEREAHEETKREVERSIVMISEFKGLYNRASEQLSAARADLEALTAWNLQSEKPCPVLEERVEYSRDGKSKYGDCRTTNLDPENYYRHTPESLAAWKAREGGGE